MWQHSGLRAQANPAPAPFLFSVLPTDVLTGSATQKPKASF